MPKLEHPDADSPIEVSADQVPMYLTQGWVKAAAKPKAPAKK